MSLQTTDTIVLDVRKSIIQTVRAKQYDNKTRYVNIKLVDGDEQIMLNGGYTVYAKLFTSKERALLYYCTENSDGTATLMLTNDILYDSGITKVEILVMDDNETVISSAPFSLQVIPSVYDDGQIVSDPEFDVLLKALAEIKEAMDKIEEIKVEEAEREANELERIANENTRISNETARVTAENERATAESTRKTNETARQTAETTREDNEDERIENENARKSAETTRASAENTRISNENTRITNENARISAENARQTAETTRETNEDDRISRENIRVSNEVTRVNNENTRIANENQRISNENTRIENETLRQTNEATRQTQEQAREESINTALTDANEALENANTAIISANTASATANEASETATQAASDATTALSSVNDMADRLEELIDTDNLVRQNQLGVPTTDEYTGIATLDNNGIVVSSQLPSYVDEILEGTAQNVVDNPTGSKTATAFILTGETDPTTPDGGKIYLDTTSKVCYRWSGTIYTSVVSGLALGTTSTTAFPGDRGLSAENMALKSVNDVTENNGVVTVYKNNATTSSFEIKKYEPDDVTIEVNSDVLSVKIDPEGGILVNNSGLSLLDANPVPIDADENILIRDKYSVNDDEESVTFTTDMIVAIDEDEDVEFKEINKSLIPEADYISIVKNKRILSVNVDDDGGIEVGSDGLSLKEFYGTTEEVNAAIAAGTISEGTTVYISDDW